MIDRCLTQRRFEIGPSNLAADRPGIPEIHSPLNPAGVRAGIERGAKEVRGDPRGADH